MIQAPDHLILESSLNLDQIQATKFTNIIVDYTYEELEKGVLLDFVKDATLEDIGDFNIMLETLGLQKHLLLLKNTILLSNKLGIF